MTYRDNDFSFDMLVIRTAAQTLFRHGRPGRGGRRGREGRWETTQMPQVFLGRGSPQARTSWHPAPHLRLLIVPWSQICSDIPLFAIVNLITRRSAAATKIFAPVISATMAEPTFSGRAFLQTDYTFSRSTACTKTLEPVFPSFFLRPSTHTSQPAYGCQSYGFLGRPSWQASQPLCFVVGDVLHEIVDVPGWDCSSLLDLLVHLLTIRLSPRVSPSLPDNPVVQLFQAPLYWGSDPLYLAYHEEALSFSRFSGQA